MIMRFISTLPRDLIAQYCDSSLAYWGGDHTPEKYLQRNLAHVERGGDLLRFSGLVDGSGRLLASLKCYTLTLHHPKKILPTLGIGAVFTNEAARKTGAASQLLRCVLDEAKQEGFAASLLFSDIAPAFYERLGFVSYPSLDRAVLFTTPLSISGLTTRAITSADEAFCHQSSLRARSENIAHLAPSLAEWRFFRWRNAQNPCLILQQQQVDVGHVIVELEGDSLWVEEWAAPNIHEEVMLATLQQLAAAVGRTQIKGWFPEPTQTAMVEAQRPDAIPMLAFFDQSFASADASFWSIEHF
jgi:GNAT superfamily N-acetyltransferase